MDFLHRVAVIGASRRRGAFDPLDYSPVLWLDASDADTLYDATTGGSLVAADGTIARWEDKSGNDRHATQATAAYQPIRKTAIKNGRDVVRWDGSNDLLVTPATMPNLQGHTIFVVEQHSGFGGGGFGRFIEVGNGLRIFFVNNASSAAAYRTFAGGARSSLNSSAPINTFQIATVAWVTPGNGTNATIYVNGVASNGATTSASSSSSLNTTAQIGNNTDGTRAFAGDIAELLVYPTNLSTEDREAVESYLNDKWAVY